MFKVRNFLLYLYIILAPSLNSLDFLTIGGVNLTTIVLLLLSGLGIIIVGMNLLKNWYFASVIALVFLCELFYSGLSSAQQGLILSVLLFCSFLVLDYKTVNIMQVNNSFFISVIVAAIFSIIQGYVGGSVARTATVVDGSIAVVALAILLFTPQYGNKYKIEPVFYVVIIVCVLVVLLFGMSRSRIILVLGLLAAKFFLDGKKKAKGSTITFIFGALLLLFFLFDSSVGELLFRSIAGRFEVGLESVGRDDEIMFGLSLFASNPLWGVGWRELQFIDYLFQTSGYSHHCMYIAILARGGIILAIPVLVSFIMLLKDSVKVYKYNKLPLILMVTFLLLAYGNAGFLNYTICSFFIPIVANLQIIKHDRFNVYNKQSSGRTYRRKVWR